MNRRYALLAPLVTPHLMLGCSATSTMEAPDRYVSSQFAPPALGSLVLLLHIPANEASYRSRDTEIRKLVQDALVKLGYRVALVEAEDYGLALQAELQQLRRTTATPSRNQFAEAEMRALATVSKAGAEVSDHQLLLRTRLLTRPADLWQSFAKWDGVTRPIVFEASKPGEVRSNIQGTASGISLEAVATGRDGRLLLKNYGGIALPFYASLIGTPTLVDGPLSNTQHLQEGVGIALSPLKVR
jgi:hypothetical protein